MFLCLQVTLRQLQKRLSGNAADFDEVIRKAKRQSSTTGSGKGSKRPTAQSGYNPSVTGECFVQHQHGSR